MTKTRKTKRKSREAVWKDYEERKSKGLIDLLDNCPLCGKRISTNNTHPPYCASCWPKTMEGRKYYAERKRASRERRKMNADS